MSSQQQALFIVQKHATSRIHYDLRLEINGVLKRWEIPKGPSMNSAEKRFAVQLDDHDLISANESELVLPQPGIVWDKGQWICEGETLKQLRQGILKFTLTGKKLRGKFNLLRMYANKWVLIKESDREALNISITQHRPECVVSGKIIEEF